MDDAVALASGGIHKKSARHKSLTAFREHGIDGVVHAAGHHGFESAAIGPRAEQMRRASLPSGPSGKIVCLLGERALAPVDEPVRPAIRPVQIVRATRQRLAVEPRLALVRDAVAIRVGELQNLRRRGNVERAAKPHRAFGKHQPVGENCALIETPVAIAVREPHDAMRLVGELLVGLVVRAAGVGNVEPPLLIEIAGDRAIDEWRAGDEFHDEAVGNRERLRAEFEVRSLHRDGCECCGEKECGAIHGKTECNPGNHAGGNH